MFYYHFWELHNLKCREQNVVGCHNYSVHTKIFLSELMASIIIIIIIIIFFFF